jgi:hypothetical protein
MAIDTFRVYHNILHMGVREGKNRGGGEGNDPTFPHCARLTGKKFPCKLSKIDVDVGREGG